MFHIRMTKDIKTMSQAVAEKGPKYFLNIEGEEVPWDQDTITTEQIAELGGWDISQGVIEVDQHNNERTLEPGEIIEIKPGHRHAYLNARPRAVFEPDGWR